MDGLQPAKNYGMEGGGFGGFGDQFQTWGGERPVQSRGKIMGTFEPNRDARCCKLFEMWRCYGCKKRPCDRASIGRPECIGGATISAQYLFYGDEDR